MTAERRIGIIKERKKQGAVVMGSEQAERAAALRADAETIMREAIRAVLRGRILDTLITDTETAEGILALEGTDA